MYNQVRKKLPPSARLFRHYLKSQTNVMKLFNTDFPVILLYSIGIVLV